LAVTFPNQTLVSQPQFKGIYDMAFGKIH